MSKNILSYLEEYQDVSIKEEAFNEVDAAIFAELSYPNLECYLKPKEKIKASKLIKRIESNKDRDKKDEKLNLLLSVLKSKRFMGMKIIQYVSKHDKDIAKQFQAITFIYQKMMIVSFSGTDSSLEGIKEDINMSYLDITPGEIESIEYLKRVSKTHPRYKMILTGHSKGGRLALTSAKALEKKEMIEAIYLFDAPNYESFFFDEEYELLLSRLHRYNPERSIIGRLITEPKKVKIIQSKNRYWQHNIFSWIVEDNHFKEADSYHRLFTKLVLAINTRLAKSSLEEKHLFTNNLCDILEHLPMYQVEKEDHPSNLDISSNENEPLSKLDMLKMFKDSASSLKDETNSVLKMIVSILLDAVRMK